ncbi:type I-F CRISPR-associated protein Csy2 [Pseudomonas sp. NY15437]|uniref:type I-F CRISPR-associated protein Csy2 n=1 Tax=Pseudomonas sp. NY15437 TaxID=3400360 RepID=UPI003A8B4F78
MAECPHVDHLLVLPRLRMQNANALSSPQTHGFPAITAFIGLMWALQRKTLAAGLDLRFHAVGVVCHAFEEQVTDSPFVRAFRLTRNPVGRDGGTAAIVEEGRIHLEISLVLGVTSPQLDAHGLDDGSAAAAIAVLVRALLDNLRIAGGSLIPSRVSAARQQPFFVALKGNTEDRALSFEKARQRLLPGFALVARDDLLDARLRALQADDPHASRLDAWLSLSRINWRYRAESETERAGWEHDPHSLGWIVPIPVGYATLSGPHAPGSVANARDPQAPFAFVESLYSVGQWLGPHRLHSPQQLLWYPQHAEELGLYRCRNDYAASAAAHYDFE